MIDKNMIALAEIRNGYTLNKYGNLTLEQNSLIKYDNLCLKLIEENQELKKQLKNYKKLGFKHLQDKNNNLETQQKEFIEWLENENRKIYRDCGLRQNIFKQVLQKYEEIIGVSDENNKQ